MVALAPLVCGNMSVPCEPGCDWIVSGVCYSWDDKRRSGARYKRLLGLGGWRYPVADGGVAEWSNATGCKPVDLTVYAGSNPAPSKLCRFERLNLGKYRELLNSRELGIITVFRLLG
jgi:hypothetical protein